MSSSTLVIRLGGLAGILAGLLYFVGYAGMAELLPVMSNLGGHVVLGLAEGAWVRVASGRGVAGLGRVAHRRWLGGFPAGREQPCRLRLRLFRAVVVGCRNVGHWVGGGGLRALGR